MDNILYKTFGKRVYKAILNLIGSGGNSNGSNIGGDIKMLAVNVLDNILTNPEGDLYTKLDLSSVSQDLLDENIEEVNTLQHQIEVNNEIIKFIIDTINDDKVPIVYIKDSHGTIYKLYDYMEFPVISNEDDGEAKGIKKINDEKTNNTKEADNSNKIKLYQDGATYTNTYFIKTIIAGNKLEADEVVLNAGE